MDYGQFLSHNAVLLFKFQDTIQRKATKAAAVVLFISIHPLFYIL